ncbi:hypothetical protein, partial [Burkholderia multivorans]|uniref:hypothetical protein n=1 Tax=Burkholderia multivorans TaxID=87883 RepID=UPI001C657538
ARGRANAALFRDGDERFQLVIFHGGNARFVETRSPSGRAASGYSRRQPAVSTEAIYQLLVRKRNLYACGS